MIQDVFLKLLDKGVEIFVAMIVGWIGARLTRAMRDLAAAFNMLRASLRVSEEQENRLRKLEGRPPLKDGEWQDIVKAYAEGRKPCP